MHSSGDSTRGLHVGRTDYILLVLLLLVFWLGVLRQIELPGLYMDAVVPDYLAARILNPALNNPVWVLPTVTIPILGGVYHGAQNLYVGLGVFSVLGVSVTSVRLAQALFGAAIVALLYLLTLRATGNRVAAFAGALLLATDIAFIASFRSQFYIILGGVTWLFASLLALQRGGRNGDFLSGAFFGLAIYGYFVLGFFLPAMAFLVLARAERHPLAWAVGLGVGLLPYAAGYTSLVLALGGISSALAWLNDTVRGLAPLSSKLGFWESLLGAWERSFLALSNTGNELMFFGEGLTDTLTRGKVLLLAAVTGLALLASIRWKSLRLALLPMVYVAVAAWFGSRLWVHHYVVLVPLAYLVLAVVLGQLPIRRQTLTAVAVAVSALLFVNLHQAGRFHDRLNETGGTRMASNALSQFAEDARRSRDALYVFPDWGFFAPFALLTENRIRYVLDPAAIAGARGEARSVVIAFWNDQDEAKYTAVLAQAGARETTTTTYRQRDGKPAFLVVRGGFP